jgi:hypothetical protein
LHHPQYNLIIDSTLGGNTEAVFRTIDMYKNNRYQVHLRVMAVPAIISKLSIFLRYETQLAEKGFARWTRMEDHDDRFEKLETVLQEITVSKSIDSLRFYERVFSENATIELKAFDSWEVFLKIRNYALNEQTMDFVENTSGKIKTLIQKRNGDLTEFEKCFISSRK